MAENKRYYFLQMPEDFFTSKRIKKLRKLAGGDTFTIIYLKMQLKAMNNHGCLEYDGLEDSIADEIATEIDEDVENVKITLAYLEKCNLLEIRENGDCYLPYAEVNVGSITASSLRSRASREKKNVAMQQQCNALATNCNGDIRDKSIDIRDKSIKKKELDKSNSSVHSDKSEITDEDVFIWFPMKNTDEEYPVEKSYVSEMQNLYPSVDIEQELRSMKAWLINNEKKAKTKKGMKRFIGGWLERSQNGSGFKNKSEIVVEHDALQDFLNS